MSWEPPTPDRQRADSELEHAAKWLAETMQQDPDVRTAVLAAYRETHATTIAALMVSHPTRVLALYEALSSMVEESPLDETLSADAADVILKRH